GPAIEAALEVDGATAVAGRRGDATMVAPSTSSAASIAGPGRPSSLCGRSPGRYGGGSDDAGGDHLRPQRCHHRRPRGRRHGEGRGRRRHHGGGGVQTTETQLEVVEGMQFDRGYLSPYFVTDPEKMEAVLENARILLTEKKVGILKDLLP